MDTLSLKEERELVKSAQRDSACFGRLFELHFDKIFNYALRRTGDVQVAQDITAEVFSKALRKLWQFQWRNVPFSAWLYKIAGNEIHAYYRKGKRAGISLDQLVEEAGVVVSKGDLYEEVVEAERAIEEQKTYLYFQEKIAALPTRYQEALALRFFEEKKVKEIAAILGKKEGTVKSLISRGLDLLRREIACGSAEKTQPSADLRIMESEGRRNTLETL